MKDCYLVEDLWPLYEEELVQPETKKWIEQHIQSCPNCKKISNDIIEPLEVPPNTVKPERIIARTAFKLQLYQLLFVVMSFMLAMSTSMYANKGFQFILTYFVLGAVLYYFYKNWCVTLLIAFIPTFIWSGFDAVMSYGSIENWRLQIEQSGRSLTQIIFEYILMGLFAGGIHTLFTMLGMSFVVLIQTAFKKEEQL